MKMNIPHIKFSISHINLHLTLIKLDIFMKKKIAHIVDELSHGLYIFGRNMNEYRRMTLKFHFCPWNDITNGTPYKCVDTYIPCWSKQGRGYDLTLVAHCVVSKERVGCFQNYQDISLQEKTNILGICYQSNRV